MMEMKLKGIEFELKNGRRRRRRRRRRVRLAAK
jgi:hypothetical protein